MTNDQKHALYLACGVAALAAVLYLSQRGAVAGPPALVADPVAPGYLNFNVPSFDPSRAPSPVIPNLGCGCSGPNDGCFTNADPNQSPVSQAQAIGIYAAQYPDLLDRLRAQLVVYGVPM